MGALRGHANSQDPSGSLSVFPKLAMQDPFIHCLSGFQTSPSLTTKSQNHFRSSKFFANVVSRARCRSSQMLRSPFSCI